MKLLRELLQLNEDNTPDNAYESDEKIGEPKSTSDIESERVLNLLVKRFQERFPENKAEMTPRWITGSLLNVQRLNKNGGWFTDEEKEQVAFMRQFGVKVGLLSQRGAAVKAEPPASRLRQYLTRDIHHIDTDIRSMLKMNTKDLGRATRQVSSDEKKEWEGKLSDSDSNIHDIFVDMDDNDMVYLVNLARKQRSKKEYMSQVAISLDKNPARIDRLQGLKFLKSDHTLNVARYKELFDFVQKQTDSRVQSIKPSLYALATKISGEVGRIKNAFVSQITPLVNSPISAQTGNGSVIWKTLNDIPDVAYDTYRRYIRLKGKVGRDDISVVSSWKRQMSADQQEIFEIIVKHYATKEHAIERLTDMAEKRNNYKSLDREQEKLEGRLSALRDLVS